MPTPTMTVSQEKGNGHPGHRGDGAKERTDKDALAVLLQAVGLRLEPASLGFEDQLTVQPAPEAGVGLDGYEEAVHVFRQL